jgi:hypothetical protein
MLCYPVIFSVTRQGYVTNHVTTFISQGVEGAPIILFVGSAYIQDPQNPENLECKCRGVLFLIMTFVKRIIAARVAYLCSRPECRAQTTGPQIDPVKALNIGVAAHISGGTLTELLEKPICDRVAFPISDGLNFVNQIGPKRDQHSFLAN